MKLNFTVFKILGLLFFAGLSQQGFAQLVGGNAFLQGNWSEVGVSTCGTFFVDAAAPATGPIGVYHGNVAGRFGFVCDAGKNGWTTAGPTTTLMGCGGTVTLPNYCGDYFVPGTPEEGFVVRVNGTNYVNNGTSGCGAAQIPGTVTSYTFTASEAIGVWSGSITIPGGTLNITASTSVPRDKTYFITTVTIANASPSTATGVYYMRTLDPDNDQPWTGNFSTRNRVRYVPQTPPTVQPDHCYALVESQGGCTSTGNRGCYLGLGAKDSRARGAFGGFTNTDPVAVWNGTGGMTNTLGASTEGDIGNSLSFNIGDIPAGGSVTIAFCYAMSVTDVLEALEATATESSLLANGADISFSGAANACNNSPIELTVSSGGSYTWTWAPCTYLNTCTGPTVIATVPSGSITYTVTGTSPCNPTLTRTVTLNATPPPPSPTSPGATIYCGQAATAVATPGAGGTIDWYTALTGGTKLADDSNTYSTGILTTSQTLYIDEYVYAPGSGNNILPYDETFECVGSTVTYSATTNPLDAGGACLNNKNPNEWQFVRTGANMRARIRPAGITASGTGGSSFITIDRSASGGAQDADLILTLNLAGYSTATDLTLGFEYLRHGNGTLTVAARRSNTATWMTLGTYSANVTGWQTIAGIDLDAVLGGPVTSTFQVRFTVNANNTAANNTTNSGFSLDNIKIRGTENTPPSFCLSTPRTPVNIVVNPLPMPNASSVSLCGPGSTTLTATKLSGVAPNILRWYGYPGGITNFLSDGASYTTPVLPPGTHSFWVEESTPPGFDNLYNFASGADGWTTSQHCSSTAGLWSWVSDGGVGAMASTNANSVSQTLFSPAISLSGTTAVTFSYRHRLSLENWWDNGYVIYRLHNGTSWGAWQKFTPTTGSYTYSDDVYFDPYFGSCSTSPVQTCYSGTAAYTTHSGNVTTTGMSQIQFAFFVGTDYSVSSGGWFIDWVRIQSATGTGALCTSPKRLVTVNVGVPSNDNICNAFVANLGDNPGHTNTCATTEPSEPQASCFKAGPPGDPLPRLTRSIWFRFTPTMSRNYLFYIKEGFESNSPIIPATGGRFDSEMALYTVNTGAVCTNSFTTGLTLNQINCNDDRPLTGWSAPHPLYSEFTQYLTTGQTVYVQVDGAIYSNTVAGGVKREEGVLNTSTANNINLFIDVILPVDMVSFSGKKADKVNILTWETAKELNVEKFEVMRSTDGRNFSVIGEVAANNAGTYTFTDENPVSRAYYRLRIVENDGKSAVSEVVYLSRDGANFSVIELKPNPTKDRFEMSFEVEKDQDVMIDLIDATGKVIRHAEYPAKLGINIVNFDLTEFNRGLYTVRLTSGGDAIIRKVVKE